MRIRDILQKKGTDVVSIEVGGTIHAAIGRLNEYGIGALIVMGEGEEIVGIITERDILKVCGQQCVRLNKAPELEETSCPTLVQDAMTKNHIRHLPILDDKSLVGIISIGDVVNAYLKEKEVENRMLRDYIHG